MIERTAREIAKVANEFVIDDGFELRPTERDMRLPKGRARVAIVTSTFFARKAEAEERALTRAVGR
jgi:hypothetical protein